MRDPTKKNPRRRDLADLLGPGIRDLLEMLLGLQFKGRFGLQPKAVLSKLWLRSLRKLWLGSDNEIGYDQKHDLCLDHGQFFGHANVILATPVQFFCQYC